MATVTNNAFVAINGIDLSQVLKSVSVASNADLLDSTVLGTSAAKRYAKGLVSYDVSGEGFFRASATTADDANGLLQAAVTSQTGNYLALIARSGTAEGEIAEMLNLSNATYEISANVGELIMATFSGNGTKTATASNYQKGTVLFSDTAITGAVNGTSYDAGGAFTGWYLNIQSLAGDGTVTVKLQHSTDDAVWVDLYAPSALSADTGYEYSSTSDNVNRYVRLIVTAISGTTNSVIAGFRGEYTG